MAIDLYEMRTVRVGQWVRLPDRRVAKLVDDDEAYYVSVDGLVFEVHPTTWVEILGWQKPEKRTESQTTEETSHDD